MLYKRRMLSGVIAGLLLAGCDDGRQVVTPPAREAAPARITPATQPAAEAAPVPKADQTAPTTRPAEVKRSLAVLEGNVLRQYDFPRARLRIDREQKNAVLYSDDPKVAIQPDYVGNSYYLVIPLTDEFLNRLDGFEWRYKSTTSEHQESADGIFLEGQRYHLQPTDIAIGFQGDGPKIKVGIAGNFFKFDTARGVADRTLVEVSGTVDAAVDVAK